MATNEQHDETQFSLLAVIDNPIRADILKSLIETNGIKCHLFDENILKQNPWYTTAIGGIKLMVPSKDLAHAKTIVHKFQQGEYSLDDDMYDQIENLAEESVQPSPHHNDNHFINLPRLAGLILIIALIALLSL